MTVVDGFYDSDTGDRIYNSQNFSDFIRLMRTDGYLFGFNNGIEVTQSGTPAMTVDVDTGGAFVQGRFIEVTAAETLNIAAADVTNPRIDRIVVRADESSGVRETLLDVLTGTPAGSPTAPALTRTSTIWEISLAQIAVAANETEITNAEITDERDTVAVCGVSTIVSLQQGLGARVRRTTNQSIPGSSTTAISFDTENHDYGDFFDIGSPTRLTIPRDGLYAMTVDATFAAGGSVAIRENGTTVIALEQNNVAASRVCSTATTIHAVKGDYFEFVIVNNNVGAVNVVTATDYSAVFTISLIGLTFT
jgi:hypothetical protein